MSDLPPERVTMRGLDGAWEAEYIRADIANAPLELSVIDREMELTKFFSKLTSLEIEFTETFSEHFGELLKTHIDNKKEFLDDLEHDTVILTQKKESLQQFLQE